MRLVLPSDTSPAAAATPRAVQTPSEGAHEKSNWISTCEIKGDLSAFRSSWMCEALHGFLAWNFETFVEQQVWKVQIESPDKWPGLWVTASSLASSWRWRMLSVPQEQQASPPQCPWELHRAKLSSLASLSQVKTLFPSPLGNPWEGAGCASSRALHHPVVPCRVRAGVQAQIPGQEQGLNPVLHCPKPMKEVMKFFTCPHFAALGTNTDLCLILHNILLFHSVPFAGGWLLCCACQGSDKQRRQTRGLGSVGGGGGWRQRRALNVSCLCHGMDSICLGLSWENCRSPAQNFTLRASWAVL